MMTQTQYSDEAAALPELDGMYVLSFTIPKESKAPAINKATRLLKDVDVLDGTALASYSNAAHVEQILRAVKGKITRESVLAATRKPFALKSPLTPGLVQDLDNPNLNREGGSVLQIVDGKFEVAEDFFVIEVKTKR